MRKTRQIFDQIREILTFPYLCSLILTHHCNLFWLFNFLNISGDLVEAEFQCQTCEVKFDHMGNVISGKDNCFTNDRDHLLDCSKGHDMCVNQMTASFSLTEGITYDFKRFCGQEKCSNQPFRKIKFRNQTNIHL